MSDIMVQSSEQLRKLFNAFDDMGFAHRYSEELGEFDVKLGNVWFTFHVDSEVMKQQKENEYWSRDASQVADYYWRQ